MRRFYPAFESDLAVSGDFAVNIAGYRHGVRGCAQAVHPRLFLLDGGVVPFFGVARQKIGFAAGFLYIVQQLFRVFGAGLEDGRAAVFEGFVFLRISWRGVLFGWFGIDWRRFYEIVATG